jgi:single-stranded DNA-binding protein
MDGWMEATNGRRLLILLPSTVYRNGRRLLITGRLRWHKWRQEQSKEPAAPIQVDAVVDVVTLVDATENAKKETNSTGIVAVAIGVAPALGAACVAGQVVRSSIGAETAGNAEVHARLSLSCTKPGGGEVHRVSNTRFRSPTSAHVTSSQTSPSSSVGIRLTLPSHLRRRRTACCPPAGGGRRTDMSPHTNVKRDLPK